MSCRFRNRAAKIEHQKFMRWFDVDFIFRSRINKNLQSLYRLRIGRETSASESYEKIPTLRAWLSSAKSVKALVHVLFTSTVIFCNSYFLLPSRFPTIRGLLTDASSVSHSQENICFENASQRGWELLCIEIKKASDVNVPRGIKRQLFEYFLHACIAFLVLRNEYK